jgi:hypothetical protein
MTAQASMIKAANLTNNNLTGFTEFDLHFNYITNYYIHDLLGGIVFVLGILFNILSFTYFQLSHSFKDTSMRYYFSVISITDSLRLIEWPFIVLVDRKMLFLTTNLCKIFMFITSLSGLISIWLLVLLSIERFIILQCPFYGKDFYKLKNSIRLLVFVSMVMLSINMPYLLPDVVNDSYSDYTIHLYICNVSPDYYVYMFVNTVVLYSCVPFLILFVFNCLIINRLASHKNRALIFVQSDNFLNAKRERQLKEKTILLIVISCFSIFTISPRYVVQMYMFFLESKTINLQLMAITKCFIVLEMTNFSFNFFFYIICSKTSRQELYLILYYFLYFKWSTLAKSSSTPISKNFVKKPCFNSYVAAKRTNDDETVTGVAINNKDDKDTSVETDGTNNSNKNRASMKKDKQTAESGQKNNHVHNSHKGPKCGRSYSVLPPSKSNRNNLVTDHFNVYGGRYLSEKNLETFLIKHSSISSRTDVITLKKLYVRKKTVC